MATLYTGRATASPSPARGRATASPSPATGRSNLDDLGAGLDYDNAIMTDEDDNIIIFHTGSYGTSDTLYTGRIIP